VVLSSPVASPSAVATPSVIINAPVDGAVFTSSRITVNIQVSKFFLGTVSGEPVSPGEGHVIYYLDTTPPTPAGEPATTTPGTYQALANTTFSWSILSSGIHTLAVELVNNDDTPLDPPVIAQVSITVQLPGSTPVTVSTPSATATSSATPSPSVTSSPSPAQTSAAAAPKAVTINMIAASLAFNMSTITVPAGADVTVNFNNQDNGIPHNLAVYTDQSAAQSIFKGDIITGPATKTYTFTAPSTPGTYFFRCDAHPTTMTDQFIVQ
jgi:plastocyanin